MMAFMRRCRFRSSDLIQVVSRDARCAYHRCSSCVPGDPGAFEGGFQRIAICLWTRKGSAGRRGLSRGVRRRASFLAFGKPFAERARLFLSEARERDIDIAVVERDAEVSRGVGGIARDIARALPIPDDPKDRGPARRHRGRLNAVTELNAAYR